MKLSISFFLVVICTMCLAAQQSQAKKGCNAYGYACYGGHGKRSLHSPMPDVTSGVNGVEQNELHLQPHPDAVLQMYPSEANVLIDGDLEAYPRYRLIKILKSWFGNNHHRLAADRLPEFDYSISGEVYNHDNNPLANANSNNNNNNNNNNLSYK